MPWALFCVFAAFCFGFVYIMSFYEPVDPEFSARLTVVGDLDDLRRPAISPFFNLTIHVASRWPACRPKSAVIMYYGHGTSIAWGEVPAFCVGKGSEIDLDVSLSSKGAILSPALRDKMALLDPRELQLQLSVDIKPIHPEHEPCLVMCYNIAAPEPAACWQRCFWPYKKGTIG